MRKKWPKQTQNNMQILDTNQITQTPHLEQSKNIVSVLYMNIYLYQINHI